MNSALKKTYGLLHFPMFLIVLVSCQLILARSGVGAFEAQIEALPVTSLEQGTLLVLFRLGHLGLNASTFIAGAVIAMFTIASTNRRQFIVNQILYLFFIYFFTTYFFMRMASGLIESLFSLLGVSIFMGCVLIAGFSGGTAFIARKISMLQAKRRRMNSIVTVTFSECKACGAAFLSNPRFCSRCLSRLS
ncbi:MAG: hypothetical protein GYA24_11570 [Candidatus Lokiarchaeota archaeon]|nr:hypothetical protein [Candidatus Lokiarchaeota archaeon]